MKVITPNKIKTTLDCVVKQVEKDSSYCGKHCERSELIKNSLDAAANSARAGIRAVQSKKTIKNVLFENREFLSKSRFGSGVTEYIQSLKDNTAELDDISDLIKMVQERKLHQNILNGFSKDSTIPKAISDDLAKLRNSDKNIIDAFIPEIETQADALTKCQIGDVCHIKGEKFIHIKNKEGKLEQLGMDKETYFRLFPPVTRFANIQSGLGDCYEITALNSVMQNPETRTSLLKCFKQSGKDIIFTFPNGEIKNGIKIKDGKLPKEERSDFYSIGSEGMRLAEYAFGKDLEAEFLNYHIDKLSKSGEKSDKFKLAQIKKLSKDGDSRQLAKLFGADNNRNIALNLREGNFATVVWSKLGFKENGFVYTKDVEEVLNNTKEIEDWTFLKKHFTGKDITDEDLFLEKIWDSEFFKNHVVECSVLSPETPTKFSRNHSMRLTPALDKNGDIVSYKIIDPYNISETEIPANDILDNIDTITFVKI